MTQNACLHSFGFESRPVIVESHVHRPNVIVERAFDTRSVSHDNTPGEQFVIAIERAARITLRIMHERVVVKRVPVIEHSPVLRDELVKNRAWPEWISPGTPLRLRIVPDT